MQVNGYHNNLCLSNYEPSKQPYTLKFLWLSQPLFIYFWAIITTPLHTCKFMAVTTIFDRIFLGHQNIPTH